MGFRDGEFIDNDLEPNLAATFCGFSILKQFQISLKELSSLLNIKYNKTMIVEPDIILKEVSKCQHEDGSFYCQSITGEHDVRFFYCYLAIMNFFGIKNKEDLSQYINVAKGIEYLESIWSYEGGSSMIQDGESNGK